MTHRSEFSGDSTSTSAGRPWSIAMRASEIVASVTTLAMMIHIIANALLRTVANEPIPGTTEYVEYWYMPVVAFTGMVIAQSMGDHIEATLLFDRLPAATRKVIQLVAYVLAGSLYLAFAWFTLQEAHHARDIGRTGGVTGVDIWPVTFVVPAAFLAMTILVTVETIRYLRPLQGERDQ